MRRARGLALLLATHGARAQEIDVHADEVVVDAKMRELDLSGHVRAELAPFFLSSNKLKLTRSARGVEVDGWGQLRFCPCMGSPLSVGFAGGTVAPPGDLVLRSPSLRVFGVPVFWLPWFWLRSPTRAGILPPELAWRGSDGLYVGGGVHAPWTRGDAARGIDLYGGAYVRGGFATRAIIATPSSITRVRFDRLASSVIGENGLEVDARGALEGRGTTGTTVAWDVDVVRGARGVYAITNVDVASREWDRAGATVSTRSGPLLVALGARAIARRGSEAIGPDAAGPLAIVRAAGDLGGAGAYDATVLGGAWKVGDATTAFARFDAGSEVATRAGPIGARVSVRGGGAIADAPVAARDEATAQRGYDLSGAARATLSLPLARSFGDGPDPLRHRVEPLASIGAFATRADGALGALTGGGAVMGEALVPSIGVESALGAWAARSALVIGAHAGALVQRDRAQALVRWRATASARYVGVSAEGAHVMAEGHALSARARVGAADGLALFANVAGRAGVDPVAARALLDAAIEAPIGFVAREGWTAGARARVPLGPYVAIAGGADADATRAELVAAIGSIELRDGCGCFLLRVTGAHRAGREGVDVFATLEVAPRAPR